MKRTVPNSSKLKPANFVRRVLSRTSTIHSKTSLEADESEKLMENRVNFESELNLLKKQIESLQITVNSMQNDTQKKEKVLAHLAKEKEQLAMDLKKQKRSNVNLKQQLEDERDFYYKEKEQYCNEMNTYKKMRQKKDRPIYKDEALENAYKNEIHQLKATLDQTLEANYNLSIKFLRMKNTKLSLKQQLSKLKKMHDKAMAEYRVKLEEIQKQLDVLVNENFSKPISPSNRKYLQVVKQNGILIHENLSLQLEVDRLNLELEKMKMMEIRNDTNSKLKYIHNTNKDPIKCPKCKNKKTGEADSLCTNVTPSTDTCRKSSGKHSKHHERKESKKSESKESTKSVVKESPSHSSKAHEGLKEIQIIKDDPGNYELMNISNSNISSQVDSDIFYCQAYRTQSAPEIVHKTED